MASPTVAGWPPLSPWEPPGRSSAPASRPPPKPWSPPRPARPIVQGHGADTERNRILDIARGSNWPSKYTARTLGHRFLDQWRDRRRNSPPTPRPARLPSRPGPGRHTGPTCAGPAKPSTSSTT
ncbi:hypothetical protein ACRAWF_19030 [Streptomyces sp. L7]